MKENNITSIEFQKNQKSKSSSKKEGSGSKTTKGKSRTDKFPQSSKSSSKSSSNLLSNDENIGLPKDTKEENKKLTRNKPVNKLSDRSNIHTKEYNLPNSDSLQADKEVVERKKHKSFYEDSAYSGRGSHRKGNNQSGRIKDMKKEASSPNISAYAEEKSLHSSVVSHSSKSITDQIGSPQKSQDDQKEPSSK